MDGRAAGSDESEPAETRTRTFNGGGAQTRRSHVLSGRAMLAGTAGLSEHQQERERAQLGSYASLGRPGIHFVDGMQSTSDPGCFESSVCRAHSECILLVPEALSGHEPLLRP